MARPLVVILEAQGGGTGPLPAALGHSPRLLLPVAVMAAWGVQLPPLAPEAGLGEGFRSRGGRGARQLLSELGRLLSPQKEVSSGAWGRAWPLGRRGRGGSRLSPQNVFKAGPPLLPPRQRTPVRELSHLGLMVSEKPRGLLFHPQDPSDASS